MDIQKWLLQIELSQYLENFKNNDIDENTLLKLTENDLKEIGINSLGHRKKLIQEIKKVKKQGIKKIYNKVPKPKIKQIEQTKEQQDNQETKNNIEPKELDTIFTKGYSRVEWFRISWNRHFDETGKIYVIISLILILFGIIFIFTFLQTIYMAIFEGEAQALITMSIFIIPILSGLFFPFLFAITPKKTQKDSLECCNSCGKRDHTLRYVNYKVGATIAGVYPRNWDFNRVVCEDCLNKRMKFAIIFQNIFNFIFMPPVSFFHGIANLVRNLKKEKITVYSKTIKLTKELIENAKINGFDKDVEILTKSLKKYELEKNKIDNKYRKVKR